MNAEDGSGQTRLTNNPAGDGSPSWSPDGTKIAFDTDRDLREVDHCVCFNLNIYVMNAADGSGQRWLTGFNYFDEYDPDWSPDGTKIAFTRVEEDEDENRFSYISVVNAADGGGLTKVSNNPGDREPSWSPDGTKIVFASRDSEIYVKNAAAGSGQTRLTNNEVLDGQPDWGSTAAPPPELDTTPPVLTVPDDIEANATTANGDTPVTYILTAEDNVDGTATLEEDGSTITQDDVGGNITISCDPSSGSEFAIGDSEVQCTATDEAGNEGTASFTVTVLRPQPEPLTAEISSNATEGDAPATFEFEAVVTGGTAPYSYRWDFDGDGNIEEESIEPTTSHTYDEPGTYTVTLTVTDANGQQASDTLEITVNEATTPPPPPRPTTPREAIEDLISFIQNLQGVPESAKTGIVTSLERALALLSDNNPRNDASACNIMGAFANQVNANERRDTLTEDQTDDLRTQAQDIRDMLGC